MGPSPVTSRAAGGTKGNIDMTTYLVHYANARHIAATGDHWNAERRAARPTRRPQGRLTGLFGKR
jgi:hypothetical protein